ncbi:hypothetical protein [Rothia halotolerans]|uniref:hypothetical protein n=1 Tax=Rothia halotolerans TaxID=405770 RepID=UPI00101B69D1|nr:hypothetical protein [Rothia halotolerans]
MTDAADDRGARPAPGPVPWSGNWRERLTRAVIEAVDGAPGVLHRESSVSDFLLGLRRPASTASRGGLAADGTRIAVSGSSASVSVYVSVDDSRPAVSAGEGVRDAVAAALRDAGWTPGTVEVTILDVG